MGTAALEPQESHRPHSLQIPAAPLHDSPTQVSVPEEFRCPISGEVMADPVIVSSGQSYERSCIQEWLAQGRSDCFKTKAKLEHTFLIPNLALKSAIFNSGLAAPGPISASRAKELVTKRILEEKMTALEVETAVSAVRYVHSATGASLRTEMVEVSGSGSGSGSSSSSIRSPLPPFLETTPQSLVEEEEDKSVATMDPRLVPELVETLRNSRSEADQTLATAQVRQLAREGAFNRRTLCQPELLQALVALLQSPHKTVVVNSIAAILNLSLEVDNKLAIVRAGATPLLVHALRRREPEFQEHAAGAIFSLALHEENRMAIGVLGAIPPLIDILRSKRQQASARARHDASMALYHLSLAQLNRSKMVKAGLVPILLSMVEEHKGGGDEEHNQHHHHRQQELKIKSSGDLASRCMCILSCLAAGSDGRAALLEINGVSRLFSLLGRERRAGNGDHDERELKEHVVATLVQLSHHNIRFKSLAAEAGGAESLVALLDSGAASTRAKEKIMTLLSVLKDPPSGVNSPSFTSADYFPRSYGGRRFGFGGKAESSHF